MESFGRFGLLSVVVVLLITASTVSGINTDSHTGRAGAAILDTTAQSTSAVSVSNVTVEIDETGSAELSLSSAPNGLAGFTVVVSVDSTSTATVTDAAAADSFGLTNSTVASDGSSARIKAADLENSITSGATDITLGSITLTGNSGGQTDLVISIERLEDDDGTPISATTEAGIASVQGAGQSTPSGGDGTLTTASDGGDDGAVTGTTRSTAPMTSTMSTTADGSVTTAVGGTTDSQVPGFGPFTGIMALVSAISLAVWRRL